MPNKTRPLPSGVDVVYIKIADMPDLRRCIEGIIEIMGKEVGADLKSDLRHGQCQALVSAMQMGADSSYQWVAELYTSYNHHQAVWLYSIEDAQNLLSLFGSAA